MSEVADIAPETAPEQPSDQHPTEPAHEPLAVVSVAAVAWAALAAIFLLLRLGPVLRGQVGGAELIHLSGAWQAHLGVGDDRFAPTLFQALTALTFEATTSEVWARLIAFVSLATIPVALWQLRPHLGEAGALLALVLLAFDAPAASLGPSASALGFDLALSVWLFVFLVRGWPYPWVAAVAGFLVAVSGPLTLPLLAGWAAVALLRREPIGRRPLLFAGGGVVVGVAVTSLRFGLGPDDGLIVAPLDLFAKGFEEEWTTSTAWDLMLLYSWPLVLAGIACVAIVLAYLQRGVSVDGARLVLVGWAAFSAAWFLAAATSQQSAPLVALTTPLALLTGPALASGLALLARADWRLARLLLPAAGAAALLGLAIVVDWARREDVGGANDQFFAALWFVAALAALAYLLYLPRARATVVAAGVLAGALVMVPGTFGVAIGADAEPLPSPVAPDQARELRDTALSLAARDGGPVVVHPDFDDEITWPFRDSGKIVIASRVPPDAAVLIWPADAQPPAGYNRVTGDWALVRRVEPPTDGVLPYLHWFVDRDTVTIKPEPIAVYSRASQ